MFTECLEQACFQVLPILIGSDHVYGMFRTGLFASASKHDGYSIDPRQDGYQVGGSKTRIQNQRGSVKY